MFRNIDYASEFDNFVQADTAPKHETLIRRTLVFLSGLILWLGFNNSAFLIWGTVYLIGDVSYIKLLSMPTRISLTVRLWLVCVASIVLGCWLGAMAIYLTWLGGGQYYPLAACLLAGLALHALSSHAQMSIATYADLVVVSISSAGVTIAASLNATQINLAVAIMFGGFAVLVYFLHSVRKSVQIRTALQRRFTAERHDAKMRAIGQFTSGVAHDFNNMLTIIAGNIELAKLNKLPPDTLECLSEAHRASQNAAVLVRHLLAYSRKSTLNAKDTDVVDLAHRVTRVATRLLPATVSLQTRDPHKPAVVHVDGPMLESALLNLIINARDALNDKPGNITIHITPKSHAGLVDISVNDNGPGMPDDVLENATDPFFTTKSLGEGSGLGLSMVSGFADQSGGNFALTNMDPRGCRATITLPMVPHTRPTTQRTTQP